jgi:hypothetical protein
MLFSDSAVNWVLTIAMAVAAGFIRNLEKRIAKLEEDHTLTLQRVSVTEAHYADILNRLGRIEDKLDSLNHR